MRSADVNCKEVGAETAKNSRLDVPPPRLGLDTSLPITPVDGCELCINFIAADFNRDGKLDLALDASYHSPLGLTSLGNGDGTFQAALASGAGFDFSVAADFNGDEKLDMVGIDQSSGSYQPYSAFYRAR
jgi:hypothetical protein